MKGEEQFSYYGKAEKIPDSAGFFVLENTSENITMIQKADDNCVIVNEEDEIRCIMIKNNDIVTYKEISVGDSVEKVTDSFQHVTKQGDVYQAVFWENTEEDPSKQTRDDNWLWISYYTENSKITMIQIADTTFMQFFK